MFVPLNGIRFLAQHFVNTTNCAEFWFVVHRPHCARCIYTPQRQIHAIKKEEFGDIDGCVIFSWLCPVCARRRLTKNPINYFQFGQIFSPAAAAADAGLAIFGSICENRSIKNALFVLLCGLKNAIAIKLELDNNSTNFNNKSAVIREQNGK